MAKRTIVKQGQKFGRLTLLKEVEPAIYPSRKTRQVECKCECGKETVVQLSHLTTGYIISCGCYGSEKRVECLKISNTTHNDSKQKNTLYQTWQGIKRRCYAPNATGYKNYGGRGIIMFELWKNSYIEFKKWIINNLGERPDGFSIDRINNDYGYFPNNVRWASSKEQANNRRIN